MYVVRFAENVFLYISKTDVLDHLRVEVTLADDLLEELEHDAIEWGVFETALLALRQGCSNGEGNDDIIGVLLRAVGTGLLASSQFVVGCCGEDLYILSMGFWPGVRCESTLERRCVAIAKKYDM